MHLSSDTHVSSSTRYQGNFISEITPLSQILALSFSCPTLGAEEPLWTLLTLIAIWCVLLQRKAAPPPEHPCAD